MTASPPGVRDWVAAYAGRLHAVTGSGHQVASPLGAWLLLALAGPASTGSGRAELAGLLGCDAGTAAGAAGALLAAPHPLVACAAAAWTAAGGRPAPAVERWRERLPPQVSTGDLPSQSSLDAWARDHTFGLVREFPVEAREMYLVLASALATRVSWTVPFDLAPAASLGDGSPWATQLDRVLRTPARSGGAHRQYIAGTPEAGDVIVHVAAAAGGLLVVSVGATPGVPPGSVLAAAHRIGIAQATGAQTGERSLSDLPPGEGPLWQLREVTSVADSCIALLPAWSAQSEHDLSDPGLGFAAAARALVPGAERWDARQRAVARYSRTGFEAAAVTAMAVAAAARPPARHRAAELRFAYPYAAVAITIGDGPDVAASPWHGLPVFSAWITDPENASYDPSGEAAGRAD